MQVVVRSLMTHYERTGPAGANRILVLPGWNDTTAGWQAMAARLSELFEVVVVDLPGFGGSQLPAEPWDLNDYANFVGGFIKKINFAPQMIIAHSNGGAIAVRGLADKALTADRLVLLASAGLRSEYKGRRKILRLITKTGKVFSYPLPAAIKKRLRKQLYKTVGSDMLIKEDLQETFKRIITDDIQASAAKIAQPTLLIYGEDDMATPVAFGRILHSLIDGSTLEILSGAGHFVHLDKPEAVYKAIVDFNR